jgi:hypothetical protein
MTNYQTLDSQLTGRNAQRRKLANNTYAERKDDGSIAIRLHATDIVTFNRDGSIVANSGGWKTSTTKDRLNQYLPVRICQKSGRWFIADNGNTIEFQDGLTIASDGSISGAKPQADADNEKQLQKRIANYCTALKVALPLPAPSAGDCFYCAMREVKSKLPLGECNHDTSHLESHFEENYFVPSLVWRSLEFAGCNPSGGGCAWFEFAFGKSTPNSWQSNQIAKFVKKYLRRQFGHKRFLVTTVNNSTND